MGQAKKDLAEEEYKEAMRRKVLESKGYTFCDHCNNEFISPYGSLLCDGCFHALTQD